MSEKTGAGEPAATAEEGSLPSLHALRVALADSSELVLQCIGLAQNGDLPPGERVQAAAAAARLIAASAQTASAIARMTDAETRQRLASARIGAEWPPREKSTNECLAWQADATS